MNPARRELACSGRKVASEMTQGRPLAGWQVFWRGFWLGVLAGLAWHMVRNPAAMGCLALLLLAVTVLVVMLFWQQLALAITAITAAWLGVRGMRAWQARARG